MERKFHLAHRNTSVFLHWNAGMKKEKLNLLFAGCLDVMINSERSEAIPGDFSSSSSMVNQKLAYKLRYLKNGVRDHYQTGRHESSSCY